MASNWRGRSPSWGSRPAVGGYSYGYSSAEGRWGKSSSSKSTSSQSKTRKSGQSYGASGYKNFSYALNGKINSFKTLVSQVQGPAKYGRPSPAVLNSFAKWVDKGAVIQTVSATQLARWARNKNVNFNHSNPSVASCKSVLWSRYSKSVIKAVCRAKNGAFLVATSPTWQGRQFSFAK